MRRLRPDIAQMHAIASDHVHRPTPTRRLEACCIDDDVDRMLAAVFHHDAGRLDASDAAGFERDIRSQQRRIVIIGEQHALAADRVGRREPPAQRFIGNLRRKMIESDARVGVTSLRRPAERLPEQVIGILIDDLPLQGGDMRRRQYERLFFFRNLAVQSRHDPVRRALKHGQVQRLLRDFRNDLHSTRGRSDHRHALTREVHRVIPPRRVKRRAGE